MKRFRKYTAGLTPQQLADFLKSQQASPLGEALPQKQEDGNED